MAAPDDTVSAVRGLIAEGEAAAARSRVEAALAAGEGGPDLHAVHGLTCLLTNDHGPAEDAATLALTRDADHGEAREVRARARISLLDADGAEADADAALRRDPESVNALVCKGSARLMRGESAPARDSFQKAFELDPRSGEAALGMSSAWSIDGDFVKAEEWAERAAEAEPLSSSAWAALAALSARDGDFQGGLELVDLALALSVEPDLDALLSLRGACLMGLGRTDEAEAELRAAEARNPLDPLAVTLLARAEASRDAASPEARERAELAAALLGTDSRVGQEMDRVARGGKRPPS